MDLEDQTPSTSLVTCSDNFGCTPPMSQSDSETWLCSIKRKLDDFEQQNQLILPGLDLPHVARVEIGNECNALREMVFCQQKAIQDLSRELEEERSASSSAANETMSMMLRLQRDKAEVQMEFRQFKRYAEEKMAHDSQELSALEDLLYKREIAIESLYSELQAYKHRMRSFGLPEFEADGEEECAMPRNITMEAYIDADGEIEAFNYPPLRCSLNRNPENVEVDIDVIDIDKYAFGDTPQSRSHLKDLEYRINQLERSPKQNLPSEEFSGLESAWEKVIVGQSPRKPTHFRRISTDNSKSILLTDKRAGSDIESPSYGDCFQKKKFLRPEDCSKLKNEDNGSEIGDEVSVRVCVIDSINQGIAENKLSLETCEDVLSTSTRSLYRGDIEDPEIQKLYMRLQALEADRETMRKTLNSMQTDKAQVVLLKEIAQHLCKDMSPTRMPTKKPSLFESFSIILALKWMVSFIFCRKKTRRCKYMFGMSARNVGLLILINKGPRVGRWRCVTSSQF